MYLEKWGYYEDFFFYEAFYSVFVALAFRIVITRSNSFLIIVIDTVFVIYEYVFLGWHKL